ncbi:hypothetical protein ACQJBY_022372 [Aegilops geniculata]
MRTEWLCVRAIWRLKTGVEEIIDAVVAARILNATLVVPKLDQTSFWKAASDFAEIFNADWFISFLSKDVRIVNGLPKIGGCYSSDRAKYFKMATAQEIYPSTASPSLVVPLASSMAAEKMGHQFAPLYLMDNLHQH